MLWQQWIPVLCGALIGTAYKVGYEKALYSCGKGIAQPGHQANHGTDDTVAQAPTAADRSGQHERVLSFTDLERLCGSEGPNPPRATAAEQAMQIRRERERVQVA